MRIAALIVELTGVLALVGCGIAATATQQPATPTQPTTVAIHTPGPVTATPTMPLPTPTPTSSPAPTATAPPATSSPTPTATATLQPSIPTRTLMETTSNAVRTACLDIRHITVELSAGTLTPAEYIARLEAALMMAERGNDEDLTETLRELVAALNKGRDLGTTAIEATVACNAYF
jgi:hypothetical protein